MNPEARPALTSSNSFRVDHREDVTTPEMTKDVETYLYEFRLRAQKKDYDLSLVLLDDSWKLGDPIKHESMVTKAHRAVMDRRLRGEPTHREEAEHAGLSFLEQQLGDAGVGDSIIWFSPPGPKEQGYGEYGFGFTGKVVEEDFGRKTVRMTANRFDKPTLEQYRQAFKMIAGGEFEAKSADDFLRMPIVIKGGISEDFTDMIFANVFGFSFDEEEAKRNDEIYNTRLKHLAIEYSHRFKYMSPEERVEAIHMMENIATEAKKFGGGGTTIFVSEAPRTLAEAKKSYSYEPEKVAGSCPVSRSNNPLEAGNGTLGAFKLPEDKYGSREVDCPNCGAENVRPKDALIATCKACGSNKISCG